MAYRNNLFKLIYKLLNDTLSLLILAYFFLLLSEGVLPGIVSSHLSFTKLTLLIFANLGAIIYIGTKNNFLYEDFDVKKSRLVFILVAFAFLMIGNSLLKFSYLGNLVITILTLLIAFYLHRIIFQEESKTDFISKG